MWGQGLTGDCSMDFVNLSNQASSKLLTLRQLLSYAEEIHPSVAFREIHPY